jgi:transposase
VGRDPPSRSRTVRRVETRPTNPLRRDLNPIEQVSAKPKAVLRAKALRTVDALWAALAESADAITPTECANYLRNAGYFQSA